jgi:hypothetical protein
MILLCVCENLVFLFSNSIDSVLYLANDQSGSSFEPFQQDTEILQYRENVEISTSANNADLKKDQNQGKTTLRASVSYSTLTWISIPRHNFERSVCILPDVYSS